MRSWKLAVAALGLLVAGPALAVETKPEASAQEAEVAPAPSAAEAEVAPAPSAAEGSPASPAAETEVAPASTRSVQLGPVGHDADGRPGRIHDVASGDTLWDISEAYLGTPWVWPSIWKDNRGIHNPHLIRPGDKIWVTPHEMRRVTEAEAEELLAGDGEAASREGHTPASLDADAMPDFGGAVRDTYRMPEVQTVGFVAPDGVSGEASIVDAVPRRTWLQDHDEVTIGLGAGQVAEGDKLAIFRPGDRVTHPESRRFYGFATEELGWMEVTEVREDGATGVIRLSRAEIQRGDHVRPLERRSPEITIGPHLDVDGRIVHLPTSRISMGSNEVVYLDRGTQAGLAVGSPLEVFRDMGTEKDRVADKRVAVPDQVIAKLLVVETHDETAVAVVTHTTEELEPGDHFRGTEDLAW